MPFPPTSNGLSPTIELKGVGVRYRLPRGGTRSIKEFALLSVRGQMGFDDFWALQEVDLRVGPGERLGVIGRNGAGKTTLLQVIAGITPPTCGTGTVAGRVAPVLQLGAGFDQDSTGRENVFLNGILLGMRRATIAERLGEIIQFAELGRFIDAPLRTYSSGMRARLGFAVAASVRPDVLLLDEVLAVGDEAFREKCRARLRGFSERGTTMLVVTHDAHFVRNECTRAIWIEAGWIRRSGVAADVVDAYQAFLAEQPAIVAEVE